MKKTVLIAGGGTGGHLSPGIALYEEFKSQGAIPLFLAGLPDLKFASLKDIDESDLMLYGAPTLTMNPLKIPGFSLSFLKAILTARSYIKDCEVDAVIGMGGYVSAPALIAALSKGIPIFLCEQNSVPGRVTRMFDKKARKIYSTFIEASAHLKNSAAFVQAGNPIRKRVLAGITKGEARRIFNLGHAKTVILAIGGSQGAMRLNELVLGLKKKYSEEFGNVGIIWSTGDHSYAKYKDAVVNELDGGSIYISPFIERVGEAYAAADFAISRSGAGVMMELAAMGLPSMLIPYPHAAMNHQETNADSFANQGAAVKLADEEAVPEKAAKIILDIINNPRLLKNMSERAAALAKPDSAREIAADILKEINS